LTRAVTQLAETTGQKLNIKQIWVAASPEGCQTAKLIEGKIQSIGIGIWKSSKKKQLVPKGFGPGANEGVDRHIADRLIQAFRSFRKDKSQGDTILVIGHQPILGGVAHRLTGASVPMRRSELIAIELNHYCTFLGILRHGSIRWVLTPSSTSAAREELDSDLAEIYDKIKSKMDAAKWLSGLTITALGIVLSLLLNKEGPNLKGDHLGAMYVSVGFFFTSIVLFLATVFSYDRLLMPVRFWGERPSPVRHWWGWGESQCRMAPAKL
jgi:hypothetical protein